MSYESIYKLPSYIDADGDSKENPYIDLGRIVAIGNIYMPHCGPDTWYFDIHFQLTTTPLKVAGVEGLWQHESRDDYDSRRYEEKARVVRNEVLSKWKEFKGE